MSALQDSINRAIQALIAAGEKDAQPMVDSITKSMEGFGYGASHPGVRSAVAQIRFAAVKVRLGHEGFILNEDGTVDYSPFIARHMAAALERAAA